LKDVNDQLVGNATVEANPSEVPTQSLEWNQVFLLVWPIFKDR
jgi:hypothetical protein